MVSTANSMDSADDDHLPWTIECFGLESASPTILKKEKSGGRSWNACLLSFNAMRLLGGSCDNIFQQWRILAFGQVISFLNVANGAAQASLSLSCHLYAPFFTLGLVYFVLALGLIPLWWRRRREKDDDMEDQLLDAEPTHQDMRVISSASSYTSTSSHGSKAKPAFLPDPTRKYSLFGIVRLSAPVLAYLPMATLDVYAQMFTLTALRYTTLTSVTLLDSVAIPAAMLLSSLLMARKYRPAHFLGIFLCFIGIFLDVFHDYTSEDETGAGGADLQEYPNKIRGDLLAIAGACMFGCQEVLGEVAVRNLGGTNEYIGMLGFWGSIIAFGHSFLTERDYITSFFLSHDQAYCGKNQAWVLLFVYILSTSLYYHGQARFLKISDAAFFNLSLLTGAAWSVLFGFLFLNRLPKPLFYVAVLFIVIGVVTYEMASTPVVEDNEGHALENKAFRRWRSKAMNNLSRRILRRKLVQLNLAEMDLCAGVVRVDSYPDTWHIEQQSGDPYTTDYKHTTATDESRVVL